MIERVVLFKLKDDWATDDGRTAVAQHSRAVLAGLPGVTSVTVGIPADDASRASWDISLVVRFASMDDVPGYAVHPEPRDYVDNYMMPKVEVRRAWNFDVGQAPRLTHEEHRDPEMSSSVPPPCPLCLSG